MDSDCSMSESSDAESENSFDEEIPQNGEIEIFAETSAEKSIEFLTNDEVYQLMEDEISEAKAVIELSKTVTKQLLIAFNWDKNRLLEKFYDDGAEKLFQMAKIEHKSWNTEEFTQSEGECEICFECNTTCISLPCGHSNFCTGCFEQYLARKIIDGTGDNLTCPGHKCNFFLGDEFVLQFVKSSTMREKFKYLITTNFVVHNRLLTYCPKPTCGNVIKSEMVNVTVECSCGHIFCFKCSEELHSPLPCDIIDRWFNLVQTDGGSKKWIYQHTKPCPKCSSPIQKNGGCNHMYCNRCETHFCWVCMSTEHGHYACNTNEKLAPTNSTFQYDDYNLDFYTNIYESMKMSLKLEMLFLETGRRTNTDWMIRQSIRDAAIVLYKNRRVLMFSYVFAYYIDTNSYKEILEQNLGNLRAATEELSGIIERNVNENTIDAMEQTVKDKICYCDTRRKIMLDFVREGYDNNYWVDREANGTNNEYTAPLMSNRKRPRTSL